MKKTFSIAFALYFLVGSLFPRTDFSQLVLLPDSYEHFKIHKELATNEGKEFCLIEFFSIHYLSPENHIQDHEEDHNNLPFQHFGTPLQLAIVDFAIELNRQVPVLKSDLPVFNQNWSILDISDRQDRPPRV